MISKVRMTESKPVYITQLYNIDMDITLDEQHLLLRLRQLANEVTEGNRPAVLILSVGTDGNIKWHETN